MDVEPVSGAPAATADLDGERALVVADYHAGVEAALRYEGYEIASRADERRDRLLELVAETGADRVVVVGDLGHAIGAPTGAEREEIRTLLDALPVPLTLVRGNHDGDVEESVDVAVTPGEGVRIGDVGFAHGHTWPAREVLTADVVCVGHEHPTVRIEDSVGGSRVERAWLRGRLNPTPFADALDDPPDIDAALVTFPAFNDLVGGTWVNVEGQAFLSPFLPEGLAAGEAYLLDGTRLGAYAAV